MVFFTTHKTKRKKENTKGNILIVEWVGKTIQGTAYANQQAVSLKIYTPSHICWNNHCPPLPSLPFSMIVCKIAWNNDNLQPWKGRGAKEHHRYSSGRSVLTKYVAECGIIIN